MDSSIPEFNDETCLFPRTILRFLACASFILRAEKQNGGFEIVRERLDVLAHGARGGSTRLTAVKAGLHHRRIFPGESGLLGNGLVSKFIITLDSAQNRLLLAK